MGGKSRLMSLYFKFEEDISRYPPPRLMKITTK